MVKNIVKNPNTLRLSNKISILKCLIWNGDMSRHQLAVMLGLTPASITQLVQELIAENKVVQGAVIDKKSSGRKHISLAFNDDEFFAIGLNIESRTTTIGLTSYNKILEKEVITTNDLVSNFDSVVEKILALISKYPTKKIIGIGVGIIGLVDEKQGISIDSYGLFEENFQIKELLQEKIGLPVFVINNVKAQAESIIKSNRDNFLFIKHLPGVGCSLIVDGKVVDGYHNLAGEIGHTIVDFYGEKCSCGKIGCLETKISRQAMENAYFAMAHKKENLEYIIANYLSDNFAKEVIDKSLVYFAMSLVNASMLTDPNKVVVMSKIFYNNDIRVKFEELLKQLKLSKLREIIYIEEEEIKTYSTSRFAIKKYLLEV